MTATGADTLFVQQQPRLFGLAYRMLGSVMDAEDIVQEAFLRWREVDRAAVREPSAFLTTLVARRCIDELRSARHRRETYVGPWLPEPLIEDPSAAVEQDESLGVAFLLLLERLGPVERAVFVLREVFDYSYAEIGSIVGRSAAACRQIMHRARKAIGDQQPRYAPDSDRLPQLIARFAQACRDGDLEVLLATLAGDAVLISDGGGQTPAAGRPIVGAPDVARVLVGVARKVAPYTVAVPAVINGDPGFIFIVDGRPGWTLSLAIDGTTIHRIYSVVNPHKLRHLYRLS